MNKFEIGSKVKVIKGHHKNKIGFVENLHRRDWSDSTCSVKFEDGTTSPFFESYLEAVPLNRFEQIIYEDFPIKNIPAERVKRIGAVSTVFTEADIKNDEIYTESAELSSIREVTHRDVTSKYFVDWFFKILKMDYFSDEDPDEYLFSMITHSDEINVYGYFNDDKLDGIIRVDDNSDHYFLSFFFVNKDCQSQGIGQYLFQYILKRFYDKKVILYVYTDSSPAIHIYKKCGFKIVKTAYGEGYRPKSPYYVMQREIR